VLRGAGGGRAAPAGGGGGPGGPPAGGGGAPPPPPRAPARPGPGGADAPRSGDPSPPPPPQGKECRRQKSGGCDYAHGETSLVRLIKLLSGAQRALDVCVFTITCNEIRDALLAAHQRGVRVRIVSDDECAGAAGSDVAELAAAGIPTRTDASAAHMHHKFAIVDGACLLTGSFNWTRQAVTANQENIVALHSPRLVGQYQGEFDRLWRQFRALRK